MNKDEFPELKVFEEPFLQFEFELVWAPVSIVALYALVAYADDTAVRIMFVFKFATFLFHF